MDLFPTLNTLEDVYRHRQAGHPLFSLGHLFFTPAARELMARHAIDLLALHHQHQHGDWGDLGADDKNGNDQALIDGDRVLSTYVIGGEQVYLLTEPVNQESGLRRSTCLMLANEY